MSDESEKVVLWDKDSSTSQQLRRPKESSNNKHVPPKHSTLNAQAKEWVPASSQQTSAPQQTTRFSAQSRLQRHNPEPARDTGTHDLNYLQMEIANISSDPGQFEAVIDSFMHTLQAYYGNQDVIYKVAEIIFKQATQETDFQYNAARLCYLIESECSFFKTALEDLCKKESEKNAQSRSFAMFLAELYTQTGSISFGILSSTLNKLLSTGTDENVNSVCKILKLCGGCLEQQSPESMSGIIATLESKKPSVQGNCKLLIESVLKLKANNWGRNDLSGDNEAVNGTASKSQYNPYAPDGDEYAEIDEFYALENNMGDPDELYDPEPEMDEEIQAAFKEFVKMSNK